MAHGLIGIDRISCRYMWHCDHVKRSSLTSVYLANPVHGGKPRLDDVIPNLATKWGVGERERIERGRTKKGKRERDDEGGKRGLRGGKGGR